MRVFVYGTLTDPDRVATVVDSFAFVGDAVLEGLHPEDGRYPTLAPGGRTGGRILATPDVAPIDAYEGVDSGLYVRVDVPTTTGETVAVYVGDPDALDADASWPGDGPFADRVRRFVAERSVRVDVAGASD
ncbi:gamma-glutamylcyclotransferase [halophilic archaeon]|nr:gamma-glutamylcyclotransferase [halophilic archaeon]